MKYIASCSFGKDSVAAIITHLLGGGQIDEAIYCWIMYDKNTSAEYPEHEKWIYEVAIPKLEKDWGVKTIIVQSDKTYLDIFYRVKQRGKYVGTIYGFPAIMRAWCNSNLKIKPITDYYKTLDEPVKEIIGIAYDEPKRAVGKGVQNAILPLVDHKIAEAEAFEICEKYGLLSPAYNEQIRRLGCWFCHKTGLKDHRYIRDNYPELWAKLLEIDKDSPNKFRKVHTVYELEERFAKEDLQIKMKLRGIE